MIEGRLARVLAAIDAANAHDPNLVESEGQRVPSELLYGHRMSATLERVVPNASEVLAIAARGQHIERWTSPRAAYPQGRVGYLRWRKDLYGFHARRLAEIMAAHGYDEETIGRVGQIVRKERLKHDPEVQTLEDVICIVFLTHYIDAFAEAHDATKLGDILAKTWAKMSPEGHAAALQLSLAPRIVAALQAGLARQEASAPNLSHGVDAPPSPER